MDSMMQTQLDIKRNAEEMQKYFAELNNWEKEVKLKEQKLAGSPQSPKDVPLPRNRAQKKSTSKVSKAEKKRISGYDYKAWDKFNVEEACKQIDGKSTDESDDDSQPMATPSPQLPETSYASTTVKKESSPKLSPKIEEINAEDATLSDLQKIDKAVFEKEQGNRFVKQEKWKEAIDCYTTAIRLDPSNAIYYANRALCHIKLNNFKVAEVDSTVAIQLDKTYVKAYQRRAFARKNLQQWSEAKADNEQILLLEPKNALARVEVQKLTEYLEKVEGESKKQESSFSHKNIFGNKSKEDGKKKKEEENLEQKVKEEIANEQSTQEVSKTKIELPEGAERVEAIVKPPHLRSKKPMKRIPIKQVVNASSMEQLIKSISPKKIEEKLQVARVQPAAQPVNLDSSKVKEITETPEVPKTYVQFESAWKSIYHNLNLRIKFVKAIPLESFTKIIGSWMESWLLSQLVETAAAIENDDTFLLNFLKTLTKVERFTSLVMFWSSQDEQNLKKCCDRLSKSFNKEKMDNLRTTYYL